MTILDGVPFLLAVHFTKGREAKIDTLVLHWMAGTLASTDATFTGGRREASAHYGIEDGTVHQYVREADTAWHAGDRPVNHRSIGIEHSAAPATKTTPARDATPATIATSVALCVALCRKYGISPDRIFPHKMFTATACPGTLPIAEIITRVRAALTVPAPPVPPVVVPSAPPRPVAKPHVRRPPALAIDGDFGPITRKRLQQWAGVEQDGDLGPISWRAIQRKVGSAADGRPGPNTWKAIQRKVGAYPDGVPGPLTIKAMQRYLNFHR